MAHDESPHTCACGGSCGCQSEEQADHAYLTQEEYVAELEDYLVRLKKEVVSVEGALAQLKLAA